MKLKYRYIIILILLPIGSLWAQQDPSYTFYRYNMNIVNPAYAGADGGAEIGLSVRSQWAGVEGSPETQSAIFGMPMGNNLGMGLSILNDRTFIENHTSLALDFSYRLKLNENLSLFLGLKVGLNSYNVNTQGLVTYNIQSDPGLMDMDGSFTPNIGPGAYLRGKSYFFSLSAPKILTPKRLNNDNGIARQGEEKIHIYAAAGYDIDLNRNLIFKPSVMPRYVNASHFSFDLTAAMMWKNSFEVGAAYRFDEAFSGFFLFRMGKNIRLGYAYEAAVENSVSNLNMGTHEILLKLKL